MARNMVCEWGMAEDIGPVAYGQEDEPIFIGKEIARHKDYSEDTAQRIDRAVMEILDKARNNASKIIESHKTEVEKLAEALLARETLIDEDDDEDEDDEDDYDDDDDLDEDDDYEEEDEDYDEEDDEDYDDFDE
jgi:ATP-dependent Zn proteases